MVTTILMNGMLRQKKEDFLNLKTAAEANLAYNEQKNIDVFVKHNIFTASELHSRYEIFLEGYCKTLNIEGFLQWLIW